MALHPGPGVFPWNPEVQGLPTPDLQAWLTNLVNAQAANPTPLKALAIRHLNVELGRRGA